MSFEQYADIVLSNPTGQLVQDRSGNLFTGTAKLYLAPPGTVDILSIDPIDISVDAGAWSHEFTGDVDGEWVAQIRAEGVTHGSSSTFRFRVNPSPFHAPEVTP